MPSRAPALPAEERRAAIIDATLPLLLERGPAVSTRQIAEAAGIAEGTIFRVFPDKDAVIRAVVERAFDPEPTEEALAGIDQSKSFERQLVEAVVIMQRRLADIWRLVTAVGPDSVPPPAPPTELEGLVRLFEQQRRCLRVDPRTAAHQLRALTLAASHPLFVMDAPMKPADVVALLLDGVRKHPR